MKLYLLGSPRLEQEGNPLHLGRRKALALLAYLAVTARSHSRDVLATLLWPEFDQQSARAELRRNLSVVNKILGGNQIHADREIAGLDSQAGLWLDVIQFRKQIAAVDTHAHTPDQPCPECLVRLTEAVSLYCDDFMRGFTLPDSPPFDQWQRYQTESLKDELTAALAQLADWHAAGWDFNTAIACVHRWLALDPLNENAHRQLMHVLVLNGQRSTALEQYKACCCILAEELDVEPGEETTRLYEQIRDGELESKRKTERKETRRRDNLPPQLTPFIGRQALLVEIRDQLEDANCHLLTLVGPGGSGKTRLALQVASSLVPDETAGGRFPDGVYFVPLAHLRSGDAIAPAIVQALDVAVFRIGDPRDQVLDYLRRRKALLVLDNYEHLIARPKAGDGEPRQREREDVDVVRALLGTALEVKLLVTSRAVLNVEGEQLYPVGGMDLPPLPSPLPFAPSEPATRREQPQDVSTYSAVQLFIAGARRVRPGFSPTADDLAHVARICHLADGIPLAILLAAAWIRVLSPAEIADEVQRRYDFLETQLQDVPERQRGVRATFDHSWDLLSERERSVLARLSVFRGGCTREAAKQVTSASLQDLMALVNQSLLQRTASGRYDVHELLRQYAAEKLALLPSDEKDACDRHCAYYAAALQRWGVALKGSRQKTARREMAIDLANAIVAWDWAVERKHVERLDGAAEALEVFYRDLPWGGLGETGFQSAAAMLAEVEARSPGTSIDRLRLLVKVLAWQGHSWRLLGRADKARQSVQQSLELLEHPVLADQDTRLERATVLRVKGLVEFVTVDRDTAREPLERSLALYRELGDRLWTAELLFYLGGIARNTGSFEEARQLYEEGLAIFQVLRNHDDIVISLALLGVVLMVQGCYQDAEYLQREAVALGRETDNRHPLEVALRHLALTLIAGGKYAESHSLLQECVAFREDSGPRLYLIHTNTFYLIHANTMLAHANLHLGKYQDARQRGRTVLTLSREMSDSWSTGFALHALGCVALADAECFLDPGTARIEAQHVLQESVDLLCESKNWDFAYWALPSLAHAELVLGHLDRAKQCLRDVLRPALEQGHALALMSALPVLALLETEKGRVERAVELYALASRYGHVANSRWWEDVAGKKITAVAATLGSDAATAAQERGRARNLEETVAELLNELDA